MTNILLVKQYPTKKNVFRDVPLDLKDEDILHFFNNKEGLTIKTGVIAGRLRDKKTVN